MEDTNANKSQREVTEGTLEVTIKERVAWIQFLSGLAYRRWVIMISNSIRLEK